MKTEIFLLLVVLGSSFTFAAPEHDPRCPLINPEYVIHLPHDYDCTLFYKCDWGNRVLFECPDGLYFNAELEVCDWPEDSGCIPGSSGSTTTRSQSESTTPTEEAVDQTTPSGDTTTNDGLDPRCPVINPEYVLHLPHEYDCTKFYKCDWGRAILFDCPAGLHFNRELQVCDWPYSAGCDESATTNGVAQTTTPNEGTAGTQGSTTSGDDRTTNNGLDPRCPVINPEYVLHLPHEYDCTKFYKCDWGRAVLFSCPPGLHFNSDLQVCDWPESAGCKDGGGTTASTIPTTTNEGTVGTDGTITSTNSQTTALTTTTTELITTTSDPRCSSSLLFPHENNCNLFYRCLNGQVELQSCPAGLHFNPRLEVCDWPADAGCDAGFTTSTVTTTVQTTTQTDATTPDEGTVGTVDTTTTSDDRTTTTSGERTTTIGNDRTTGVTDSRCPQVTPEFGLRLPHEYNCTLFYVCDRGQAVLQSCPPGLHFNRLLQLCDWPESAGCDFVIETTTRGGLITAPTEPPVGTDGPATTEEPKTTITPPTAPTLDDRDPRCPTDNSGNTVLFPHETNCNQFYKCDWGVLVLSYCPPGLHFNSRLNVCDWPASAGCMA